MIIAVDFDGTIVEHDFPRIGPEVPGAFHWLRCLQDAGASLMLWTMRSGTYLDDAVSYCRARDLEFWAVNENPGQVTWTASRKQYAHLYIDDAALGCPLTYPRVGAPPMVDWSEAGPHALAMVESYTKK